MGLLRGLGKALALPVRIVNSPLRAIEHGVAFCVDGRPCSDEERTLSLAGEVVAKAIEETTEELGR
jgi:hypothetical protein